MTFAETAKEKEVPVSESGILNSAKTVMSVPPGRPTSEPWSQQHERVADAVRQHGLPVNPLEGVTMDDLVMNALADAAEVSFIPAEQLQLV